MPKKNTQHKYTPDTHSRVITVDLWKALGALGTAILVSSVGTAFTVGSVLNSDHFLLANATEDIKTLQGTSVRYDVYTVQQRYITEQLENINKELAKINAKLER